MNKENAPEKNKWKLYSWKQHIPTGLCFLLPFSFSFLLLFWVCSKWSHPSSLHRCWWINDFQNLHLLPRAAFGVSASHFIYHLTFPIWMALATQIVHIHNWIHPLSTQTCSPDSLVTNFKIISESFHSPSFPASPPLQSGPWIPVLFMCAFKIFAWCNPFLPLPVP